MVAGTGPVRSRQTLPADVRLIVQIATGRYPISGEAVILHHWTSVGGIGFGCYRLRQESSGRLYVVQWSVEDDSGTTEETVRHLAAYRSGT